MISVAIVEDNDKDAKVLEDFLLRYGSEIAESLKVTLFSSGKVFLDSYTPIFDVVFMDIEMPDMNGMETAKKLRLFDQQVRLVFVTNVARYAIEGYSVGALDYVLKPIYYFDVKMRMERIKESLVNQERVLSLPYQGGVKVFRAQDIVYLESSSHLITIHTTQRDYTTRNMSIRQLEMDLKDKGFVRSNTCYIVNLRYCEEIEGDIMTVGKQRLPISRSRKKEVMEAVRKMK